MMMLFAGPNGSGKTTIARLFEERLNGLDAERINADEIAQQMLERLGGSINDHVLAAAQESDDRVIRAIAERRSFSVETVLSTEKFKPILLQARDAGFEIVTVFVYLRSPETNISRIANRVAKGGHYVPDDKVIKRHSLSLANLEWCDAMSDWTVVYENDRDGYGVIAASRLNDSWAAHDAQAFHDFVEIVRQLWTPDGLKRLGISPR